MHPAGRWDEGEQVMAAAIKTMMWVAVAVLPGAFVAVLAFLAFRTLRHSWLTARQRSGNGPVPLKDVVGGVSLRSLVQEARAVAF